MGILFRVDSCISMIETEKQEEKFGACPLKRSTSKGPSSSQFPLSMIKREESFNVLYAEDSKVNQKIIENILIKNFPNCKVSFANDGVECLTEIDRVGINHFNFILLDNEMPHMNGPTVVKRLRENFPSGLPPLIGVSASNESQQEEFIKAGLDGFVPKPVIPLHLFEEIERCLKEKKSE